MEEAVLCSGLNEGEMAKAVSTYRLSRRNVLKAVLSWDSREGGVAGLDVLNVWEGGAEIRLKIWNGREKSVKRRV